MEDDDVDVLDEVDDELVDDELRNHDDESRELLDRHEDPEPELELELELDERYRSPPPARPRASRWVMAASPISIRKMAVVVMARIDPGTCFM